MVDLEGTLSDHDDRLAVLREELAKAADERDREAWKKYYRGLPDDAPRDNVMWWLEQWIAEGDRPVVYSTRFPNKYRHEELWLTMHNLWGRVDLLNRDRPQIKGPALVVLWAQELEPNILVDDREEVRVLVQAHCPDVTVYGPDDLNFNPTAA